MEELKIIDIINYRNKYGTQQFVVVNRKPTFVYERKGRWLIAEDSGFFSFYYYERPSGQFYAFAGREFDIPMTDGTVEHAYGQWWYGVPPDYQELVKNIGYNTPEDLAECNVFIGIHIDPYIIDQYLSKNDASNNYYKYDYRNPDYGKQNIISKWNHKEKINDIQRQSNHLGSPAGPSA